MLKRKVGTGIYVEVEEINRSHMYLPLQKLGCNAFDNSNVSNTILYPNKGSINMVMRLIRKINARSSYSSSNWQRKIIGTRKKKRRNMEYKKIECCVIQVHNGKWKGVWTHFQDPTNPCKTHSSDRSSWQVGCWRDEMCAKP